jgi:hypothetical protein
VSSGGYWMKNWGGKYLELDDALFRVMDDIAEAIYMKGAADRELMIR